jgi:hypothetical protein
MSREQNEEPLIAVEKIQTLQQYQPDTVRQIQARIATGW